MKILSKEIIIINYLEAGVDLESCYLIVVWCEADLIYIPCRVS